MISTLKFIIGIYHLVFQANLRACRFDPTCSKYLIDSVEKHGFFKGSVLFIKRIFSCHPFSSRPIIDPA